MKTYLRYTFLLICLSTGACGPKMRIAPGQIPTVEAPSQELKVEAEGYVSSHINESNHKEIKSGADLVRVKKIIDRLSRGAGYPPNTFPVHLVDAGEEVNAAAFNGASIVVYRELLVRVPNDDELATVLGHEIGHIIAKHYQDAAEEQSRAEAVGIGSSILGLAASIATSAAGYGGVSGIAGDVTEGTSGLIGYGAFVGSFNRTQEYEADHLGLLVMAKAGYDPARAVDFWNRSEEVFGAGSSTAGAFFSTHPASSDRMKALQEAMPYAQQFYTPVPAAPAPKKKGKAK